MHKQNAGSIDLQMAPTQISFEVAGLQNFENLL